MYKMYEMELAGRTLRVDVDRVAKQANGAVLMHYGDTTVLCTSTASEKPRDGIDFFPLSVEYNERLYAVGKIPGGFNKREGKASENAILTDRVIDRPMRPLFPKDYRNDVTLENLVMSVDQDCSPELTAMLGASLATSISDIPFDGPISTTQVGLIDGEFVFNPTAAQREVSDLALTVASTKEKVIMIEAGANEVPEDRMIEAIFAAHELNQKVIAFFDTIVAECGKPKHEYESCAIPEELFDAIKEIVPPAEMEQAVFTDEKQIREDNIRQITEKLEEAFAENEEWLAVLPEADDVEIDINPNDLQIDTFRSSGAGGQHINKTSSAIRITHLPTGMVVECQDERSQYKNKDKALKVLKSRLLKIEQDKQNAEISENRKSQVGSGDRSEKIRTYNFPQSRVTDHRIGLTLYKLDDILNGNIDEIIDALIAYDRAEKLKESMENK